MGLHKRGSPKGSVMMKILTDFSKCTECRICELACSFKTFAGFNPRYACLTVRLSKDGLVAEPMVCIHCQNPACMKVCPVSAITRDEATGAVVIDENQCTGCQKCIESCYYGAVRFHSEKKKAFKCNLCYGQPECVRYCPTGALQVTEVQK